MHCKYRVVLSSLAAVFFSAAVSAQSTVPGVLTAPDEPSVWVNAMVDPSVNVYDAVAQFEAYWKDRPVEKGHGWKQFRRWQAFMEPRVYPTGERPNPTVLYQAQQELQVQLNAQKGGVSGSESTTTGIGNWTLVGPVDGNAIAGIGRVNAIAFHPTVPNRLFAGAPAGGLWRSDDNGATWSTNTDLLPNLGVSAIAIDPLHPDTMYIGTGDRDAGDTYSIGVLKTVDGGQTWTTTGLTMTVDQNRRVTGLAIHPTQPQTVVATTRNGIFRTTDGGTTWSPVQGGTFQTVQRVPGNGRLLYASTYNNTRIFRSTDFGATWSMVTTGLPTTNCIRSEIATTAADTNYVYAVYSANNYGLLGVYRSTDRGVNWTQVKGPTNPNLLDWGVNGTGTGGQGWYDLAIAASPVDKDVVLVGGVNIWRSSNGGTNWTLSGHWTGGGGKPFVHADVHILAFKPNTAEVWAGCDGGMYVSPNSGSLSWSSQNMGLSISQYYKIAVTDAAPAMTLAGSQDNGTHLNDNGFDRVRGGDGMDCGIAQDNPNVMYSSVYYGDFRKSTNRGQSFNAPFNLTPSGSGNWVTPFLVSQHNSNVLYAGFSQVWKSANGGATFTATSAALNGTNNMDVLAESPSDQNVLAAAIDDKLYRSVNGGASWTLISGSMGSTQAITGVAFSHNDPNRMWVTRSGYQSGQKVYETGNGGISWANISANLPNIPANCVVEQPGSNGLVYVGTDLGVFYKDATLTSWIPFMQGLPNTVVNDLEILMGPGLVRAGTYGRGIWQSPLVNSYLRKPQAAFAAQPSAPCTVADTVNLRDASGFIPTAWSWTVQPATHAFVGGTSATSQNPRVVFSAPGNYLVQLIAQNAYGADTLVNVRAAQVGGASLPWADPMDLPLAERWNVVNPGNDATWSLATVSGNAPGTSAAVLGWNAGSTPGSTDALQSTSLNLTGAVQPRLVFEYAYRRKLNTNTDSLFVLVSTNCGATWTRLKSYGENGSGSFATGASTSASFVPNAPSDWRRDSVSLAGLSASTGIRVAFVGRYGGGNNLYIDNINLKSAPVSPVAALYAHPTSCVGRAVTFYSTSSGQPTSYLWTFPGGTPSTSTAAQPTVVYTSPGSYAATLQVTSAGGTNTVSVPAVVAVSPAVNPTVSITASSTSFCKNAPVTFTANASGAGSTPLFYWTVNGQPRGNAGNTFTINTLNTGDSVRVALRSSESCAPTGTVNSAPVVVNVLALPTVGFGPYPSVCQGSQPFQLMGNPAGGAFSGSGVSGSMFYPANVGPGNFVATYTYTNAQGCTNTDTALVRVVAKPTVLFSFTNKEYCITDAATPLNMGYPTGGTYKIGSQTVTQVNPATLGLGTHVVTYQYSNSLCSVSKSDTVFVKAAPSKPWVLDYGDSLFCTATGVKYQWLDSAGVAVPGANSAIFKAQVPGYYRVRVSVGGCSAESNTFQVVSTPETEWASRRLWVVPTVTTGPVAVQFATQASAAYSLEVLSSDGSLLMKRSGTGTGSAQKESLDLSGWAPGVYFVRWTDAGTAQTQRVVLQRP